MKVDRKNKKKKGKGGMKVQSLSTYQSNEPNKRSVSKGSNQDQQDANPDSRSSKSRIENES